MQARVETSGWDELIRDWRNVHHELMPALERVTSKGALNIKRDWAAIWEGHPTIAHLPRAINYDLARTADSTEAEIGAAHERMQGTLAHIIEFANTEYGTLRNAPIPGGQPSLDAEEPRYVKAIADAAEEVIAGLAAKHGR